MRVDILFLVQAVAFMASSLVPAPGGTIRACPEEARFGGHSLRRSQRRAAKKLVSLVCSVLYAVLLYDRMIISPGMQQQNFSRRSAHTPFLI